MVSCKLFVHAKPLQAKTSEKKTLQDNFHDLTLKKESKVKSDHMKDPQHMISYVDWLDIGWLNIATVLKLQVINPTMSKSK